MKPKAPKISEAQFQRTVIEAAQRLGWLVHHVRAGLNRRGQWSTAVSGNVGFFDLVLAHRNSPSVVLAELKTEKGVLSDAQRIWWNVVSNGTTEVHVWRPSDWPSIESRLKNP